MGAAVVFRADRRWQILAYASLVVHAHYLLAACVEAGLPRYALAMWPVTAFVLFGTIANITAAEGARHLKRTTVSSAPRCCAGSP